MSQGWGDGGSGGGRAGEGLGGGEQAREEVEGGRGKEREGEGRRGKERKGEGGTREGESYPAGAVVAAQKGITDIFFSPSSPLPPIPHA
jgi:hypothetical protein